MNFRLWVRFYEPAHPKLRRFKQELGEDDTFPVTFNNKQDFMQVVRAKYPQKLYLAHTIWDRFTDYRRRQKFAKAVHADHD